MKAAGPIHPYARFAAALLVAGTLAGWSAQAAAQSSACGDLKNAYGPFDYRKDRDKLPIVDDSHFTPPVEALVHGVSGPIGSELDYALRAFPNHHRALVAMTRWSERLKNPQPPGAHYTIDCYYDRALRFAPDDTVTRMLYAQFLAKGGRKADALSQLQVVAEYAGDSGFTHYNLGLMYLELTEYDRARAEAWRASALGFERPELRLGLEKAGKWQDPPPEAAAASASGAASGADGAASAAAGAASGAAAAGSAAAGAASAAAAASASAASGAAASTTLQPNRDPVR